MLELWRQSKGELDMSRPNVRTITKSAFLALSGEELGELLEDFLLVKDTDVSAEFLPR